MNEQAPIVAAAQPPQKRGAGLLRRIARNSSALIGAVAALIVLVIGSFAPLIAPLDPAAINPVARNKPPGFESTVRNDDGTRTKVTHHFGTDSLGRDVFSRTVHGTRNSVFVGVAVAVLGVALGLVIGLVSGYFRAADGIIMRFMDGLMAIPEILLAMALVSLSRGGSLTVVVIALVVPAIPRIVRVVRSVVLSVREEPYVEAAVMVGTPTPKLIYRHVLPNTIAPLIVQGTFVCASAILLEAILSFLGIGLKPEFPTWGNIMAEGRAAFLLFPHTILYPGIFLAVTVLAVNMLGDGLRDALDPKMAGRDQA